MSFLPENGQPVATSIEDYEKLLSLFADHKITYCDFSKPSYLANKALTLFRIEDKQEWTDAAFLWLDLTGLKP